MNSKTGRVVIVTGGATGIGRAIAKAFSDAGEQVVIMGRRLDMLQEAASHIRAIAIQSDVSKREEVVKAVKSVTDRFGTIDVLVNNAGFNKGSSTRMTLEEAEAAWDEEINVNLKGSFLMSLVCAPHLRRPGGRIINMSSIAAYTGGSRGGAVGYAAAKLGLNGLTYGLARELSPQGITVNAIAPGLILDTEFTAGFTEERIQNTVEKTPMGRPGFPQDIAAAALYLASPQASFVTGEVLHVNGGWYFGH